MMGFLCFGLALLGIGVGFLAWFCYHLLRQNGRILRRLETLEQQLQQAVVAAAPTFALPVEAPVFPVEAPGSPTHLPTETPIPPHPSLPVGQIAPDFTLPDLEGKMHSLSEWRGRPILLVFFSARCGFCTLMAPDLAAMPLDGTDGVPMPLVVTNGTVAENKEWIEEHGVRCPVLRQEQMEIANRYEATGTPMGYLIDAEGRIASEIGVGSVALLALADEAAQKAAGRNGHEAPKRHRTLSESRIAREGLPVGTPAPDFRLPALNGEEISLEQYHGEKVLLVFSDPQCGPCDALAPRLEQKHQEHPELPILMISRGDLEANRAKVAEHHLTFPVVLQRKWEVSKAYAMFATPVAYLIDETGTIMTEVAVGAEAILALLPEAPVAAAAKEVRSLRN